MKKSPFQPDIAVYSHHKTWLTELLINRLPKGMGIFESCRWEDPDACLLAFHGSKINVFVITPSSVDLNNLASYKYYMDFAPERSIVLLSMEPEKNKKFSIPEKKQLDDFLNSCGIPQFATLNACANHVKHTYSRKGSFKSKNSKKSEFSF